MIDDYLTHLDRRLKCGARERARLLREVREHLEDAVRDLESSGVETDAAREQAIRAFGPGDELASQFNAQEATARMRQVPVAIGFGAAAVVAGFLLAAITQPQPAVNANAATVVRVAFFAAVVGMQVVAVAGARAASLVASRWRTSSVRREDRMLVRDAAVICVGGMAVAVCGWTIALVLVSGHRPHDRPLTLAAGVGLMVVGALGSAATLRRPALLTTDGTEPGVGVSNTAGFRLGERLVVAVNRNPGVACCAVALLGAIAAMSGAETTFVGALPSGVFEAAAVVVGFVVLGPRLGLRPTEHGRATAVE